MEKIRRNLVYLADNLTNMNRILLYLLQNEIISLNESHDIRKADTPFNQNCELLDLIQRKDISIDEFLEILRNTKNEHCARQIGGISREGERKLEKPKILQNTWWPDKKVLIKSLYERKIGDKLLIEELHQRISKDEERRVVICESEEASKLTELGGVGKTLTATWYAHNYENEYDHVIWINCGEGCMWNSFKKLARDLKIEDRNEFLDLQDYIGKSYGALKEYKCLWIFDNAENYQGYNGIIDVLPIFKDNFYCLITSRWRDWGIPNIGYGQMSRLEVNIFKKTESLEFLKKYLKYTDYTDLEFEELCRLLGNLPLGMQLAVAALNTGKINLKNYIEKTSTKEVEEIVNTKFDAYGNTISASVNITLELIGQEEGGAFAKEVLNIFGYIRPGNVGTDFLTSVFKSDSYFTVSRLANAIQLLSKYSLITQVADEGPENDGDESLTVLTIHPLLQQVLRHNGSNTGKDTLRKILGCEGFVDCKALPFIKYADKNLREEFPELKRELLDLGWLERLMKEKRYDESESLIKIVREQLQK